MSFVPPATTSSAFYHPAHTSMYDPRLKNWSTWAAEAARGPALPETPAPPARPLDLFPDSDSSDEAPSFAPPRRMIMPGEHVAQNPTDPANALWNIPGQSAQGSEHQAMFAQPVSQWPADIAHQYNEIATNPTTFSLPNSHRQNNHRGPMPAHMMPRGVHIDPSFGHLGHHQANPPAHPMVMAPTPPDLVPAMESLALVPAVKPLPPFRPPIDLYRNNINPPARPPSAPPALAAPVPPHADQIPIAPISMAAPPPAPTKLSDSAAPAPIPPNAFNLTQYMPYSAPAPAHKPPPTSARAYMTAHMVENHINAVPATTAAAAPRPVTPKIAPPVPQPPVPTERPHQQRRNSATIKKGILQETLYQEPPASSWHTTWFDNGPYPPVVPLSLHEPAPIKNKQGRKRGASVSAFQTPSSLVQPLHAYGAGSHVGISAQHTGTGDKRSGMFSPTDHLDALLAGAGPTSRQQIPQPPGTAPHPFFLESLAPTPTAPIKPTVGGGYPWYTPTATEAPHPAVYGGLFGEEPAPPQKSTKQKKGDDKENAQAHLAYAYHEMATAAPVKEKDMRKGAPAPGPLVDTTSLWTDKAAESWYTSSVPTTSGGGNKIKKSRPQPAPSHATTPAAQLQPTPILRGPNETAAFYGMAVKFADEPVTKKKGKR